MADLIIDTGPLVGWINGRDQWHRWSAATLSELDPPLITCEAVIAEAAWLLARSRDAVDQLCGLVDSGALRVSELLPDHISHIRALSAKYPQMDFCDAAVVRLSEMFPRSTVITTDSAHFTVYRRFGNKPIGLIHPEIR